jgi:hypothetical protein
VADANRSRRSEGDGHHARRAGPAAGCRVVSISRLS